MRLWYLGLHITPCLQPTQSVSTVPSGVADDWLRRFRSQKVASISPSCQCAPATHWPEIRVRAQHLKANGTLGHPTVKALLRDRASRRIASWLQHSRMLAPL